MLKKLSNLTGVTPLSASEQKNLKGGVVPCGPCGSDCCMRQEIWQQMYCLVPCDPGTPGCSCGYN